MDIALINVLQFIVNKEQYVKMVYVSKIKIKKSVIVRIHARKDRNVLNKDVLKMKNVDHLDYASLVLNVGEELASNKQNLVILIQIFVGFLDQIKRPAPLYTIFDLQIPNFV